MSRVTVHFAGEGSGVAELTWGQLELWGAMRRQRTWMPLPVREPLPSGTTLDEMAGWLRYVMSRHQAMRTRLALRPDGPPRQVVHGSGDIAMDVVEAGDEDPVAVAQRTVDRFVFRDFDFEREWPVDMAIITRDGVPAIRVFSVCHLVTDAFGAMALMTDLARRAAAPDDPAPPLTATEPLAQADWQCSPAGRRHSETALRHWAEALRELPARRFPPPVDRGEPRHWGLVLVSPAIHRAVRVIRHRTGANSAQVILTLFLVALTQVTGVHPAATRVAVNNRFRRGLADTVSVITQYGLCAVDVAGITIDEALARVSRRVIATFKHAYFDPIGLARVIDEASRERGEEVDLECYYNDRRLGEDGEAPGGPPPAVDDVLAALPQTTLTGEPITTRASERFFAAVEEAPDALRLVLEGDTRYLSRDALAAIAVAVEERAVAAARDASATTGVPCLHAPR
jgi:hypothetical protein